MTEMQRDELAAAMRARFGGEVEIDEVGRPGRFRFAIRSPAFEMMAHLSRQDALWEIVDRVLPREATLDVAMILAFAPSDLEEVVP